MPEPVVLSGSSLSTFMRCGQQWYYAYVVAIKSPPTVRQALGLGVHSTVERNMSQKVWSGTDISEEEALDTFSTEWDAMVPEIEDDPTEAKDVAKDSGLKIVKMHHREVAPKIQPLMVEEPVAFELNGVPYSGTIDLVDTESRVRDWKTAARRPHASYYVNQMTGYAIGYRQKTGSVESDVVLDFHVRTKTPSYVPIASGGPISDSSISNFAGQVELVYRAINRGDFLPNGAWSNPPVCSWCGYRDICPASAVKG
jgi:CRISPR/Cas system-associated exonuclease Cas4 (RecB family)